MGIVDDVVVGGVETVVVDDVVVEGAEIETTAVDGLVVDEEVVELGKTSTHVEFLACAAAGGRFLDHEIEIEDGGADPDVVVKEGTVLPTVKMGTVSLAGLTNEELNIAATLLVTNPNCVPLPLVQISSSIVVGGGKTATVASFNATDVVCTTIDAHGSGNVDLLLTVLNYYLELIKDADTYDIAAGTVEFKLKVELTLEITNAGIYTLPYEWEVKLPLPRILFCSLTKVGFKSSYGESTEIALYFSLDNPNVFDLDLHSLHCQVSLAGVLIGSLEMKKPAGTIRKRKIGLLKIPFTFNPKKFGQEFCKKITGSSIDYSLQGTIDVQTPYGQMKMPIIMKDTSGTSIPLVDEPRGAA